MLDPEGGRYFGLDPVGRRIWELIEAPISVEALCGVLTSEFDIDLETCRREVLPFLQRMHEADLVDLAP